jgi:hypothetical protein
MRRSNAWILLLAVLLLPTTLVAKENQHENAVEGATVRPSRQEICRMIEQAAAKERLPFDFFTRLIWRESRFDPGAVSPAGAQGIAQFMPRTANGRGLENPFDPVSALMESAEYLRELLQRFGNLGLAAAAYNAGPKRVQDWLAKRGPPLRQETRDYVEIITGHGPHTWAGSETPQLETVEDTDCDKVTKVAIARQMRIAAQARRAPAQQEARQTEPAAPTGARGRKVADARDRKAAGTRERNGAKTAGRLAASEQLSARSRLAARSNKARLADSRRKSGPAPGAKRPAPTVKTARAVGKRVAPVRIAARSVARGCAQRNGGRRTCRDA